MIKPICEIPEGATRVFTAPDPEGHQAAVVPGSFLDRNFEEVAFVLLGQAPFTEALEKALPRDMSKDSIRLLRRGVSNSGLNPARLLSAVRALGLAAQVPCKSHNSELLNGIWTERYIRGYLRALSH